MNRLNQILENCLQAIENGDTIETAVSRYPELANELRPLLEIAVSVKNKNMFVVSSDVVRRNRTKLLQHAAEMRESQIQRKAQGVWFVPIRRLVVTLIVLVIIFASGTSLARASSVTVPGDGLYPVKRTLENVLVLITFNHQQREVLELEQENERLDELQEVFDKGRSTHVDFSGLVATQNADQWFVSGIKVLISSQTNLPQDAVAIGSGVHVVGHTQNGFVQAESIELISLNEIASMSTVSPEGNNEMYQTPTPVYTDNSGIPPEATESISVPEPEATAAVANPIITSKPFEPHHSSFKGIVQSLGGNFWMVNGVLVDVHNADISGKSAIGVVVKVDGYFDQNGVFVARRIELPEKDSGIDSSIFVSPSSTPSSQHDGNDEHDRITVTPESGDGDHHYDHVTATSEPEH